MAESRIPVDLLNPGQVFACIGLMESAEILLGGASAGFSGEGNSAFFHLAAQGDESPILRAMRFLEESEVVTRMPAQSGNADAWKWGDRPVENQPGEPFPFPDPKSPATLPITLKDKEGNRIDTDHWGDATKRDNVKFWAGSGGYPGAALMRDALEYARGKMRQHASAPFALSHPQQSSFRFDWRRDYVPIQDGFSPNRHGSIHMRGFPLVEILAAIGLSNARPLRLDKLKYQYGILIQRGERKLVDPIFHRAALGARKSPVPGQPLRRFTMRLDWPGQEDQARCITQVIEEEA